MATNGSDVLELLQRHNPISPREVAGAATSGEARTLVERITASPYPTRPRPRRPAVPRRALAVAAVLSVVAAGAILPAVLLPDQRLGASPAAAATLERLAAVAASTPPGWQSRYAYAKARTLYMATAADPPPFSVLIPSVRESWIAADGSGRIWETAGAPIFFDERDRARWTATGGWTAKRAPTDRRFGPRPFWAEETRLPTDPDRLLEVLREKAESENPPPEDGYSIEGEMLEEISSLLHSPAASPALRAALYRVMAKIDGVELVGDVTDPAGRAGVALSGPAFYGRDFARRLLIIDPHTSSVLAEQTILEKPIEEVNAQPPVLIGQIVYVDSAWVDSTDATP